MPHPTQGHINPALQFAKRLTHKRVRVTLALTKFILKSTAASSAASISLRAISDGFDDGGRAHATSSEEYRARFEQIGQQTLSELLRDLAGSGQPVDCVVYDPFNPWVLDVAKRLGLPAAALFTQSCAVVNIYHQTYAGELKLPLAGGEVVVPGLPAMEPGDMPSFFYDGGSHRGTFQMVLDQFRNVEEADWIFINTFDELEEETIKWMSKSLRVKAIGPTIPSFYLDKRLKDDKEYGLNIFNPTTDVCTDWLSQRPPRSVIYVSFGSLSVLTTEQTEELAWALRTHDSHFLWVVRSLEGAFPRRHRPEDCWCHGATNWRCLHTRRWVASSRTVGGIRPSRH